MKLEAGRGRLVDAQKQLQARWESVCEVWRDSVRQRFGEEVQEPLDQMTSETLRAVDQLRQVFREMQSDCSENDLRLF